MRIKKTKKSVGLRGKTTHGHGARKKWKKSGHKGGVGMAGSGKRADQKKTLINKKYGNKYFGKKGITSKGTARKKVKKINLIDVDNNYDTLKKHEKDGWLDLREYKLLGKGDLSKKIKIRVLEASSSARAGVEKAGGEIMILKKEEDVKNNLDTDNHNKDKGSGSEDRKSETDIIEDIKIEKEE